MIITTAISVTLTLGRPFLKVGVPFLQDDLDTLTKKKRQRDMDFGCGPKYFQSLHLQRPLCYCVHPENTARENKGNSKCQRE